MSCKNTRRPLQVKPGARCRRGDKYSLYIRFAALLAISKGANKKEIAALLKCHPATLRKWERDTPPQILDWWKNTGRGETPRDCPGCCPGTALKGRRAAVCLLCNGARYTDITEITGIPRAALWRYLREDAAGLCISKATARRAAGDSLTPSVTPAALLRGKPFKK